MTPLSYLDLYREFAADIEAEIATALAGIAPSTHTIGGAVTELLGHRELRHPLSVLPMLVHAAETGAPQPAVPLAAVHVLWWKFACYLDDLADGPGAVDTAGLRHDEALLAAVVAGNTLPTRIIHSRRLPEPVRASLAGELVRGWFTGAEGQLRDLRAHVGEAARETVTDVYRGKSGAPFGMITAMGALLARAKAERVEQWREFGCLFGILWQLFNDQEDILSGRNEDLANGTVTYLLACAVEQAPPPRRERIRSLSTASKDSEDAREELMDLLTEPALLEEYRQDIDAFRDEAHRVLDELGGQERYLTALRNMVDQSGRMLLRPGAQRRASA
ncbi:polyprenyl synthetase family protein [Streptomyces sp. GC420]|uniref:polyprenyl synthetase family protein n=1 Tax=Streptomyces sp. GC420 TaxID=2697568 RepID=UPI0028BF09EF|nr:polyprenyl synthetase family protein [Streptomyces sp. GC420]